MTINETRYLLFCMAEESGELSHTIGKCGKFGTMNHHPDNKSTTYMELLQKEWNDVIAVGEMLGLQRNQTHIQDKMKKVNDLYIKSLTN